MRDSFKSGKFMSGFEFWFNDFFILIMILSAFVFETFPVCAESNIKITIEDALRMAVENSYELKSDRIRLESAKAGFAIDIRQFLPSLSVTLGNSESVIFNGPDTYTKQVSLKLSQPITTGGRVYINRTIANINLLLEQKRFSEQIFGLQDKVWKAFYELLMNREKARLRKDAFEVSMDQLKIARLEKRQGSITELELLETEIEVKKLEVQIADTDIEIKELEYNLNKLLGLKRYYSLILKGKDLKEYRGINIKASSKRIYAAALNRNLNLKSLKFQLTKSKMQLNLIKKRFIPSINGELSFSVSGNSYPLQNAHYGIGLNIAFPSAGSPVNLSLNYGEDSGGRNRSGSVDISPFQNVKIFLTKRQAEIAVRDSERKLEQFKSDLNFSIEQAVASYLGLKRKLILKREIIAFGIKRLEVLKKKLDIGELERLDYLKEKISLSEEEVNYINDVFSLLMAERDIERLAGLKPGMLKNYAVVKDN